MITTIPKNPIQNQNFFINYNDPNNIPVANDTYVLQNITNNMVSNVFKTFG